MSKPYIRIERIAPGRVRVFMDGIEVGGLKKVTYSDEIGEASVVTLEIIPIDLLVVPGGDR